MSWDVRVLISNNPKAKDCHFLRPVPCLATCPGTHFCRLCVPVAVCLVGKVKRAMSWDVSYRAVGPALLRGLQDTLEGLKGARHPLLLDEA